MGGVEKLYSCQRGENRECPRFWGAALAERAAQLRPFRCATFHLLDPESKTLTFALSLLVNQLGSQSDRVRRFTGRMMSGRNVDAGFPLDEFGGLGDEDGDATV